MGHSRGRAKSQRGQIMILFTLMIVLLMGLAAIVVDVGVLRRSSAMLATSVDAGALAGGAQLPATSLTATAITTSAVKYLNTNYPSLGATSSWISYLCLVKLASGLPDGSQIPSVCDPGSPAKTSLNCTTWRCGGGVATATCVPSGTNICNVIVVAGAANVGYTFGGSMGLGSGSTGTVQSAACSGDCGAPSNVPMDVVLIIDRTQSMVSPDRVPLQKAKTAARTMLLAFNPSYQYVGLGVLPPSDSTKLSTNGTVDTYPCAAGAYSVSATLNSGSWGSGATWSAAKYPTLGLATNYQTNSTTLNESSQLVNTINCLDTQPYTDQGTAVAAATDVLNNHGSGRLGVKKVIVLLTDGQPQGGGSGATDGTGVWTCSNANSQATAAKTSGIDVYTIGFFDEDSHGAITIPKCPDLSGTWHTTPTKTAVDLLSSMSTQPGYGTTDCTPAENTDLDHFFCLPKSADLTATFHTIVTSMSSGAHLLALP